ncbi:polyubiquitin-like [Camellia sinensis]|uniref:polyubiquitin-like n=1 Tax=Camellia sinensis TaxID=4442 RepID=UPI001035B84F|nr:polyubiquitin-like [Camellia sinensis]
MNTSNTVKDVKKMIEDVVGVPPSQQLVVENPDHPPLDDEEILGAHNIQNLGLVWLLSPSMKLQIKISQAGTCMQLDIYSSFLVSNIKDMIHDNMGVPSNRQTLVYSGRSLNDDKALSFYDIPRNSTIYAIFGVDNGTSDLLIFIDAGACLHKGELKDSKTVKGYNMDDGSFISLNVSGSLIWLHIKVKSQNMTQNVISIQAKSSDTVDEFIAKIPQGELASIVGEPALFLEETRLMGDNALAYYDLHSRSSLTLERAIQIHVAIPSKQTVKVNLKASDPIYQMKEKIEETCGIPNELQQLTYHGDAVDDMLNAEQCEELLGNLWVLRWNWAGRTWSFFWPSYMHV